MDFGKTSDVTRTEIFALQTPEISSSNPVMGTFFLSEHYCRWLCRSSPACFKASKHGSDFFPEKKTFSQILKCLLADGDIGLCGVCVTGIDFCGFQIACLVDGDTRLCRVRAGGYCVTGGRWA